MEKKITLTYAERTGFSISDDNKVTVAGTEYSIDVSAISAMPKNVEVEAGGAVTEMAGIDGADQAAVGAALAAINVKDATVVVAQAANEEITEVASDLDVEALLEKQMQLMKAKTMTPSKL